ncbi:MAG: SWIM zinc finger family protein, partial [Geminicoccaceae bacterium]
MPSFGLGDIRRTIPEAAFARAERYVRQGRVCAAGPGEEAGSLIGRVQGTERKPYEQHIRVIIEGRACRIIGLCSCPVGANCKHVGAVLLTALEESPSDHAIPLAAALQKPRRKDIAPKPHLRLMTARLDYRRTRYWQMPDGDMMAIARLSFDYGGARVGSGDKERALTAVDGDQVFSIPRDLTAETRFRARLEDLGFERIDALGLYEVTPEGLSDFIMIGPDPEEELMDPEQAL